MATKGSHKLFEAVIEGDIAAGRRVGEVLVREERLNQLINWGDFSDIESTSRTDSSEDSRARSLAAVGMGRFYCSLWGFGRLVRLLKLKRFFARWNKKSVKRG